MNRSLLNNAIIGITTGYSKTLELSGVGYRAALKGKQLNLQLGFSHDINFDIPDSVKIIVEKQTIIKITGQDKQRQGQKTEEIQTFVKRHANIGQSEINDQADTDNPKANDQKNWHTDNK